MQIRILIFILLTSVSVAVMSHASGDTPSLVAVPDPLILSGEPGGEASGSIIVHVSNTTRPLSIVDKSTTPLQDDRGNHISSSSITFNLSAAPVRVDSAITVTVCVSIPGGTAPGNYTSMMILFADNGAVASESVHLIVKPALSRYLASFAVIFGGVLFSFLYSPFLDKKDGEGHKFGPRSTMSSRLSYSISRDRLEQAQIRDTLIILLSSFALSIVAFAYFLTTVTEFGASLPKDFGLAFLQGFLVHRSLDGLKDKVFK